MKQDKETKLKLLASARMEFMEKGYMNASLRNICRNAGVTTGALYFFFKDKADLYESLTRDTVAGIFGIMNAHFSNEHDMATQSEMIDFKNVDNSKDIDDSMKIVHIMYEHRDDVLLVLTKSQGSPIEGIVDKFIETAEAHYKNMAHQMERLYPDKKLDDRLIHWLSHEMIEMFVYMITHIEDESQAVSFMKQSIAYMISGWYGLFMI